MSHTPKPFFPRKKETFMKHVTPMTLLRTFCGAILIVMVAHSQQAVGQNTTPTPQAAPTPEFLSITVVSVKPDMIVEFQNFMKTPLTLHLRREGSSNVKFGRIQVPPETHLSTCS